MPRSYHVDIAQHAAQVDRKWLDNLLSRHQLPGVEGGTQGVSRKLSVVAIYHIALIRVLSDALGSSVADAVVVATRLLADPAARLAFAGGVHVGIDYEAFKAEIDGRIAEGVESVSPAQRGRPRGSRSRRL